MNVDWISRQLDYIYFAYGVFLTTLFLACFFLHTLERDRPEKPAWLIFGLFGGTCGIHEWFEMASLLGFESRLSSGLGLLLIVLAYLFLLEFGRRATPRLAGARAAWVLYGTLLLLALSGLPYGLSGIQASVRYFLALPAGTLAAWALFREFKRRPAGARAPFLLLSVAMAVFAVSTLASVPKSGFALAGALNSESFLELTGFPVQLPRGLLALLLALLLGWYSALSARLGRRSFFGIALALALLTTIGCGWYFTEYLGRQAARELEKAAWTDVAGLVVHINDTLRTADMTALNLAEYPALAAALATRAQADLDRANVILDQHRKNMNQAGCYLMNKAGLTIASSSRAAHDSFVGESYVFHPYFTEMIAGRTGKYFALGVTSGERGYYTGSPVRDRAGMILGIVVVKSGLDVLAKALDKHEEQFLVSPEGVIFLSGSRDYLSRTLWPLAADQRSALLASKQFGTVSFEPLLEREPSGGSYLRRSGRATYVVRDPIGVAGWSVVLLHDTTEISISRMQGIGITFVVGFVVMFAFMILASSENSLQTSLKLLELQRRNEVILSEQLLLQHFIAEVNQTLQSPNAMATVLQQETEIIVNRMDAAFARIWTLNPATNLLELAASAGLYTHLDGANARIPVGRGKIGQIAREGRFLFTNEVIGDPGVLDQEWARREGMQAFAGYPLRVDGRVIGVLAMFARQPLQETALEILGMAATFIASYIDRKRAEEALLEKTHQLEDLTRNLESKVKAEIAVRTRNEQMLVQQTKMAAMGEMLGAIAHQWRQPLNTLGMCVQNIGDVCAQGELDRPYIDRTIRKSMDQIQHMSTTIDDFRNFFLPDKERSRFDAMLAVGDVLSLMSAQLMANNIGFRLTCHTHARSFEQLEELDVCPEKTIEGYRNEFEHVILNLIINARDAVATRRETAPDGAPGKGLIAFDFFNRDGTVIIEVGDNGTGIPEAIMPRIFEPYFTAKDPSKGTGIGLYMSKIIIEEHMKGGLAATNGPAGAVFSIRLPQAEKADVS